MTPNVFLVTEVPPSVVVGTEVTPTEVVGTDGTPTVDVGTDGTPTVEEVAEVPATIVVVADAVVLAEAVVGGVVLSHDISAVPFTAVKKTTAIHDNEVQTKTHKLVYIYRKYACKQTSPLGVHVYGLQNCVHAQGQ